MSRIPVIPLRLAEATLKAGDVTPVMLFPIGEWQTNSALYAARYPKGLPLTQDTADAAIANFNAGVLGGEVQFSLAGAHNVPASAAFWLKRLYCAAYSWQGREGDALWADVKWTQAGADSANGDEFKYVSVELGAFTTNDGEEVPWVLQGGVMTNYPLIRIMPPVRQGADAIAASEGEREAEFEIALADVGAEPDPVQAILDDMDALAAKADAALKGKKGMPSFRTMLREARSKVGVHKIAAAAGSYNDLRDELEAAVGDAVGERCWVCDFGDGWVIYEHSALTETASLYQAPYERTQDGITLGQPVEVKRRTTYVSADSSPAGANPAGSMSVAACKDAEGRGVHLAEGDAAQRGVETTMNPKTMKTLNLAEGADDVAIDAAVMALAEERDTEKSRADTAENKVAEIEKAKRAGEVEVELSAIEKAGNLKPGEKAEFLTLAEDKPEVYAARIGERKALKPNTIVDLAVHGTGSQGDGDASKRADIELADLARARATKDGIGYTKAMRLELSENTDLAARYDEFLTGKDA